MAVRSTGLDSRLAMPGLTVILALVAFWFGTRRPNAIKDFPASWGGTLIMTAAVLFVAFWFGARNPDLFGKMPVIGEAAN